MSSVETGSPTATVQRIFEILNEHDVATLRGFATERLVETWPVVGRLEGEEVAEHFAAIFAALPDFHIEIERIAADGETVFAHWRMSGRFTGAPLLGFKATGRRIDMRGTDCFTIRDGKVARNFIAYDGMTFAAQAGVLPEHGSRMDRAMTTLANWHTRARKLRRPTAGDGR